MAKLALINREAKRARLVAKFAAKRAALVALVEDSKLSDEERMAARLALQTGAEPLAVRCERLPWGRGFLLHVEPLQAPLSDDLETAVAQINAEMERVIRARPEQYLWGYGRYKQPRRETPPDEPKAQPTDKV